MGSSKSKTTSSQTNSLPTWLTNPYQQTVTAAGTAAAQPAIGAQTQQALDNLGTGATYANNVGTTATNNLSSMASGNLGGTAGTSLTNLSQNGGLDTGYIDSSNLNATANGNFLTADSNPYIQGVAQQGADAAQARINAQFGAAGRSTGSGLYAQLLGQGISNATDQVYKTNYQNERALQQQAQTTLLGDQQATREAALNRQLSASQNVVGDQLSASGQIPGLLSAMTDANNSAANAGEYSDTANLNQIGKYSGILSSLAAPYAMTNGTSSTTTSTGLGSILGSIAGAGLAGFASGGFKFGKSS